MKIVLTGGGTAGHAMVGSVIIPMLAHSGWSAVYIGSADGVERSIIEKQGLVRYKAIPTGKLRRYFSFKNLLDPFKIIAGIIKAFYILKKEDPHVVYSGGGYVSVPVVIAAWTLKIPVLIRETDYTVGLANRICLKFATAMNVTFSDTSKKINTIPVSSNGIIVRPTLLQSPTEKLVFKEKKPTLLVMGGSLGALAINSAIRKDLLRILLHYNVIHLCGVGNADSIGDYLEGYRQFEFLDDMTQVYEAADYLLMRCGSNAICEGLVLGKNMICVPLTKSGSRGEQYENAEFAVKNGNAVIVNEDELSIQTIMSAVAKLESQSRNTSMMLTQSQLYENCIKQISQLHSLGLDKLQRDFMENICHGKAIDFFSLNNDEIMYYNEIAERYGG